MIDITGEIAAFLNDHARMVHEDAMKHDLFYGYDKVPLHNQRLAGVVRIMEECDEAMKAIDTQREFAFELADIILTTESIATHFGIDIGDYIEEKRMMNMDRPKRHG